MNNQMQNDIELSAILNLVPYFDTNLGVTSPSNSLTLGQIYNMIGKKVPNDDTAQTFKKALDAHPEWKNIELINQSSTNNTSKWTDDLIQGCTFRDAEGNYYVSYRGTGDGRWPDNGEGMVKESTTMQEEARKYFDKMAEEYLLDAHAKGKKIIVTGHSKGGNEAQYVYMTSDYEHIITNCISYDGQGFSDAAMEMFIKKYGEDYRKKLSKMYSICGENDYVHDFGRQLIPIENTYFTKTTNVTDGKPKQFFESLHCLNNMLYDENGNYTGIQWSRDGNGNITNGEQGELGKYINKIVPNLMELSEEDLEKIAVFIMSMIDSWGPDKTLSDTYASPYDMLEVITEGLPIVISGLLTSEEGLVLLFEMLQNGIQKFYENYGLIATIGLVFLVGLVVYRFGGVIIQGITIAYTILSIVETVLDFLDKLAEINDSLKKLVSEIRETVVNAINKIISTIKSLSFGNRYATANPSILVDPDKLETYAGRLERVNTRLRSIDRRMNSLYTQVAIKDICDLLQADVMTDYSTRLNLCAKYLNETAYDFKVAENAIKSKA